MAAIVLFVFFWLLGACEPTFEWKADDSCDPRRDTRLTSSSFFRSTLGREGGFLVGCMRVSWALRKESGKGFLVLLTHLGEVRLWDREAKRFAPRLALSLPPEARESNARSYVLMLFSESWQKQGEAAMLRHCQEEMRDPNYTCDAVHRACWFSIGFRPEPLSGSFQVEPAGPGGSACSIKVNQGTQKELVTVDGPVSDSFDAGVDVSLERVGDILIVDEPPIEVVKEPIPTVEIEPLMQDLPFEQVAEQISERSADTPSHCVGARSFPNQFPMSGPVPPACPTVCNGGCADGVCLIVDPTGNIGSSVTCPAGMPCRVRCLAANSCRSAIRCGAAKSCDVECRGPDSCRNLVSCSDTGACRVRCLGANSCSERVTCGQGPCHVLFDGGTKCAPNGNDCGYAGNGVDCTKSSLCNIQCIGERSCRGSISCGTGTCDVLCLGNQSCWQGDITCGTGACKVICDGGKDCTYDPNNPFGCGLACSGNIRCQGASRCDLRCIGPRSCRFDATCNTSAPCRLRCTGADSCWQGRYNTCRSCPGFAACP